jgi:hypothetical protein
MQRVLISYTKYFNIRHDKSGHLFQGAYKSVRQESDEQLMHLSAYIHKNPVEIAEWKGREQAFPWSSYMDCLEKNRFPYLLNTEIVTERFEKDSGMKTYQAFVSSSPAKEITKELFKV